MTMEEYIRKVHLLRDNIKAKNVVYNWHDPQTSYIEATASKIAQNIVALLAELGSVPEELRECIAAEKREDTLAAWLKLAVRADSIEELQSKM